MALAIVAVGYAVAILPSALFAGSMEWLYRKRAIRPQSLQAIKWSAIGGILSGLAIGLVIVLPLKPNSYGDGARLVAFYLLLGAATGFLVGIVVRFLEKRSVAAEALAR